MYRWQTYAAAVLLGSTFAFTIRAQEAFEWQINNGTIIITSYRLGAPQVVVPETITGLQVTGIGSQAFYRNNNVREVVLPTSITNIGYCAFQYCGALANINFPPGLEHIDGSAFDGTALQVVNLPASLRTVGQTPFFQCANLQAINVESANASFTSVDGVLFSKDRTQLIQYPAGRAGEYLVPASVYEILDRAFHGTRGLTKVTIPGHARVIGYYAFNSCDQLAEVTLGEGITHIGDQAFGECKSLGAVGLPASLQSLGNLCFSGCTGLPQVTLPEGLTTVGGLWAFNGCTALGAVTIPGTVTNAGYGTFAGCTNLQTVTISEGVQRLEATFQNCRRLSSVSLPQSLVEIGEHAFDGCTGLTTVAIPAGVTNIGWYSFANCGSLQSPALPAGLQSLGRGAFQDCHAIQTLTLPEKVREVGDGCFQNCSSLTRINIPAATAFVGAGAFSNCPQLQAVNVAEGNSSYSSVDGVLFNADRTVLIQFATAWTGRYAVPLTVRRIEYDAFKGASGLVGVTLPPELEVIQDNAFAHCTGLVYVRLPAKVTEVANYAFSYCTNLTGLLFEGNAPIMTWAMVYQCPDPGIYRLPGTSGWDPPPQGITPTVWNGNLAVEPGSYGLTSEGFKLTAVGNTNVPIAFQACSGLAQPDWVAFASCRLTNGNVIVIEPLSAGLRERYYRVAWPD